MERIGVYPEIRAERSNEEKPEHYSHILGSVEATCRACQRKSMRIVAKGS